MYTQENKDMYEIQHIFPLYLGAYQNYANSFFFLTFLEFWGSELVS
jgi:hypothetical protein